MSPQPTFACLLLMEDALRKYVATEIYSFSSSTYKLADGLNKLLFNYSET